MQRRPTDFFGNLRKTNNAVDIGAIEFTGAAATVPTLSSISPASHTRGNSGFTVTLTGTNLTGTSAVNVSGTGVGVSNIVVVSRHYGHGNVHDLEHRNSQCADRYRHNARWNQQRGYVHHRYSGTDQHQSEHADNAVRLSRSP